MLPECCLPVPIDQLDCSGQDCDPSVRHAIATDSISQLRMGTEEHFSWRTVAMESI